MKLKETYEGEIHTSNYYIMLFRIKIFHKNPLLPIQIL